MAQFTVDVTATYRDVVVVEAESAEEARRLVAEEGYPDGADYVVSVDNDADPEIVVQAVTLSEEDES